MQKSTFENIINLIRKEEVVLFVGAGCSIASGAPSVDSLTKLIIDKLDSSFNSDATDIQKASAALILQNGNREVLNEILIDSFSNLLPSDFHKALSIIPFIHDIITTNYDTLIEDAIGDKGQVFVINDDCTSYSPDSRHIFKIHGDISHLNEVVISEDDYRRVVGEHSQKLVWNQVYGLFSTKHIVFIGYSLSDPNFLNLVDDIISKVSKPVKQMYLIAPSLKELTKRRLEAMQIAYIPGDSDSFVNDTLEHLRDTFGEDFSSYERNKVAAEFGRMNGVLFNTKDNGASIQIDSFECPNENKVEIKFKTKNLDLITNPKHFGSTIKVNGVKIPAKSLSIEEMQTLAFLVNGLNITKGIKPASMYIGLMTQTVSLKLSSRLQALSIYTNASTFRIGNEIHVKWNIVVGEMELVLSIPDRVGASFPCRINTDFYETFSNLNDARIWLKLIRGFGADTQIKINSMSFPEIGNIQKEQFSIFNDYLEYCENLSVIEASSVDFGTYERMTPQLLSISRMVKSYYLKEDYVIKTPDNNERFCVTLKTVPEEISVGNYYVMRTVQNLLSPVVLCGHSFTIPQERCLRMKNKAIEKRVEDNGDCTVVFEDHSGCIQISYNDIDDSDSILEGNVSDE